MNDRRQKCLHFWCLFVCCEFVADQIRKSEYDVRMICGTVIDMAILRSSG